MSRARVPSVNASLIHEARMILQHFISGRQSNVHSMPFAFGQARAASKPICIHPVLKCAFCVETPVDATVVINGYSVCARHEPRARSVTS